MELTIRIRRGVLGAYWATCPSLPNCLGHGQTHEEAAMDIQAAIARRLGGDVPSSPVGLRDSCGVSRNA